MFLSLLQMIFSGWSSTHGWISDTAFFLKHHSRQSVSSSIPHVTLSSVFIPVASIHYTCSMFVDVLYLFLCTWTLYFSLSSLFYHVIRVGDCSWKTLVINRDLWYAKFLQRWPEWQTELVLLWKPARRACFLLCPALKIIQCFLLSAFSQSGYLLCVPYIGLFMLTILCFVW